MNATLEIFAAAVQTMEEHNIDYGVFGGIAVWEYGQKRDTKDIDLLLRPPDADRALGALAARGFATERTDPIWLYKATKDDVNVDMIFEVAGGNVPCETVLARKRRATIEGIPMNVIGPEDLILIKMAVIKTRRAWDWFDALAVLKGSGGNLDWDYMIERSQANLERLLSLLLFAKTAGCAEQVPDEVLRRLAEMVGLAPPGPRHQREA